MEPFHLCKTLFETNSSSKFLPSVSAPPLSTSIFPNNRFNHLGDPLYSLYSRVTIRRNFCSKEFTVQWEKKQRNSNRANALTSSKTVSWRLSSQVPDKLLVILTIPLFTVTKLSLLDSLLEKQEKVHSFSPFPFIFSHLSPNINTLESPTALNKIQILQTDSHSVCRLRTQV